MEAGASERLAILTLIPSPLSPALLYFSCRANFVTTGQSSGAAPHDESVTETAESCTAHVLLGAEDFTLCCIAKQLYVLILFERSASVCNKNMR